MGSTTFGTGVSAITSQINLTTDATGKVYFTGIAGGAITATTPSGCVVMFFFSY
jgi:hypothetical protein